MTEDEFRQAFARSGGLATKAKHPDQYATMGRKGHESRLAKYGPDYYKEFAAKGLAAKRAKQEKLRNGAST